MENKTKLFKLFYLFTILFMLGELLNLLGILIGSILSEKLFGLMFFYVVRIIAYVLMLCGILAIIFLLTILILDIVKRKIDIKNILIKIGITIIITIILILTL